MIKNIVFENINIKSAMNRLQTTAKRCLVVVDKKNILLGTISDGDIRRSLLKGASLNSAIKNIYNKKPFFIYEKNFKSFNYKNKINLLDIIPVTNAKKKIIKIIYKNKILNIEKHNELKNIPVVIMAGGQGTRMVPFTKILPKPLLPMKDSTVIENIFQRFINYGCKNFYLTVNYKAKLLQTYIEETKPSKIKLKFIKEKKALGTAGGLYFFRRKFKKDFFLCNCDTLIDADFSHIYDFHIKNNFDITLIAAMKNVSLPYGVCMLDKNHNLIKVDEKPNKNFMVNTGSYVLSNKVPNLIKSKSKEIQMDELINSAKKKKLKIGVYPIEATQWHDTGNWIDFQKVFQSNFD